MKKALAKAKQLMIARQSNEAIAITTSLLNKLRETNQYHSPFALKTRLVHASATIYADGSWEDSLDFLWKLKKDSQEQEHWEVFAETCRIIAQILEVSGRKDQSLDNLREAQTVIQQHQLDSIYPNWATRISSWHRLFGDKDSSVFYANEAVRTALKLGKKEEEGVGHLLLGMNYSQKDINLGINHFQKSAQRFREVNNFISFCVATNGLARLERRRGNMEKAMSYLDTAFHYLSFIKGETDNNRLYFMTLQKGDIFQQLGQLDSAIYYLKKGYQQKLNHFQFESDEKAVELDNKYNISEKTEELEVKEQEVQTEKERKNLLLLVATLILFLLGVVIFYYFKLRSANTRNRQMVEQLKELDVAKSRLYTNLTHEFRTPLTVILGMAEKIQSTPKRFAKEGAHIIKRNGNNLLRIINQLLDLSKLENHALKLQLQQSDIVAYLNYITEAFHSYANDKNLSIRFFSNEETLLMDHDQEQIKQVMTNLISNAIKFTPSGGDVKVKVLKEAKYLQIAVKDNGIGIPGKALPLIFDRFYQVDDSMTRAYEGTGIGLAHARELVKLMDGSIEVESKEEEGSTFIIRLPIRNEAPLLADSSITDVAVIIPTVAGKEVNATANLTDLPTILIIEDNPDVVIYLKSCLDKDYHLEVAYNGDIGIEMAIEKVPDLIVSDVMMPGKDGFEVCNILKLDERTSHIPIILLTAKADIASKLSGLERGADAYLAKPFNPEELSIRLNKLLEGRKKMKKIFGQLYMPYTDKSGITSLDDSIPPKIEDAFIKKLNKLLEERIQDEDFGLPALCRQLGMSRSQLFRKTKALTNMAPSDYIRTYRLQKAKYLLEHSDQNVTEVAYEVGFKNPSYFSNAFQKAFGFAPSALKK